MMMKGIKNEKGIALVMVLILSLIGLAMVSAMLFMLTQGIQVSSAQKFYRTAEEASYGGMELAVQYLGSRGIMNLPLLPLTLHGGAAGTAYALGCNCNDPYNYGDNRERSTNAQSDRCDKLCNPTSNWPVGTRAADTALIPADPANMTAWRADFTYTLGVAPATFTVFTKIVDTVQGNSDVGGLVISGELGGAGVVASNTGIVNPPHNPYLYRVEIQSQATANPRERARLSLLYAY